MARRAEMATQLKAQGWEEGEVERILVALEPFLPGVRPVSEMLEATIRERSFRLQWEIARTPRREEWLLGLVDETLQYYEAAARAEGDDQYEEHYRNARKGRGSRSGTPAYCGRCGTRLEQGRCPYCEKAESGILPDVEEDYLSYTAGREPLQREADEEDETVPAPRRSRGNAPALDPAGITLVRTLTWLGGLSALVALLVVGVLEVLTAVRAGDPAAYLETQGVLEENRAMLLVGLGGMVLYNLAWAPWTYQVHRGTARLARVERSSIRALWMLVPGAHLAAAKQLLGESIRVHARVCGNLLRRGQEERVERTLKSWWSILALAEGLLVIATIAVLLVPAGENGKLLGGMMIGAAISWLAALLTGSSLVTQVAEMQGRTRHATSSQGRTSQRR